MQRRSLKRATAAVLGVATMGVGLVVMTAPASADEALLGSLTATTKPVIVRGNTQVAGNIEIDLNGTADAGDTITIDVEAPGGGCGVGFSAAPADNVGNVTIGTEDPCNGPGFSRIILTIGDGGLADGGGTDIILSTVRFDVGPDVDPGNVTVKTATHSAQNALLATVDRVDGADRFGTAAAIAQEAFGDCIDEAVLVSGRNFPDALAASYLGKPIFLTEPGSLPDVTKNALQNLGVERVTIVGGTEAVSSNVFLAVEALAEGSCGNNFDADTHITTVRLQGGNRYDTARVVATQNPGNIGTLDPGLDGCSPVDTAIVVSGENFPDALAAGPLSARGGIGGCGSGAIPIVLTPPNELRSEAAEALGAIDADHVLIIGGDLAVSESTEQAILALPAVDTVTRVEGATRWETALELAKELRSPEIGFTEEVLVANGLNFPDALVGGPFGGTASAPIILTEQPALNSGASLLISLQADIIQTWALGGPVALAQKVLDDVNAAYLARN